jgi:rod shape-determining protein MreC
MAVLDIRQRTGWLFLAVTVGHIILISAQVTTKRGVPVLEQVTFGTFAEIQRAASSGVGTLRDGWENYFALQQIRRENTELKQEVAELRMGLQQERSLAQQSRKLQELLELHEKTALSTTGASIVGADVIGDAASPYFRTMTISKGTGDGLRPDMAVIAPAGVVGRVILPTARAAKIQLLIDRNAAAGALIERSRAQGVVVGTGTESLRMEYVSSTADVKTGDLVVTSGIDGIYPKGFVIGQIESVKLEAGVFSISIRPAVAFSALEAVLVVLTPPPAPETAATKGPRTSTDTAVAHEDR